LVLCDSLDAPPQFLSWPDSWQIIVAYQNTQVKTKDARNVLPDSYPRNVLVKQAASLARFVHGLNSGDLELAARNIVDLVAEPYREQLLPGFEQAKRHVLHHGGLAAGISGSGPTMFAIVDNAEKANELAYWLKENYAGDGFVKLCKADRTGARQLTGVEFEVH
jgi:homoserine kinase